MISYQTLAISVAVVVAFLVPIFFIYAILHILDSIRLSEYLKKYKPERWRELNPAKKHPFWGLDAPSFYPKVDLDLFRAYLKSDQDNEDPVVRKLKQDIQWFSRKHTVTLLIMLLLEALLVLGIMQYYGFPKIG